MLAAEYSEVFAALDDKRNQGVVTKIYAVYSCHQSPHRSLYLTEQQENKMITHDRAIVRNYFYRFCIL